MKDENGHTKEGGDTQGETVKYSEISVNKNRKKNQLI